MAKKIVNFAASSMIAALMGLAILTALAPFLFFEADDGSISSFSLIVVPLLSVILIPLYAGLLAKVLCTFIRHGELPQRRIAYSVYLFLWQQIAESRFIFSIVLSVSFLKKAVLRLFGYRASNNFVLYPNTMIKNPLMVEIGEQSHLAAAARIGYGCLVDCIGKARVKIGERCLVGESVVIGCGTTLANDVEIEKGAVVGLLAAIGANSKVGAFSTIGDHVILADHVEIGERCFIENEVRISPRIKIPSGLYVPAGTDLRRQHEVTQLIDNQKGEILYFVAEILGSPVPLGDEKAS